MDNLSAHNASDYDRNVRQTIPFYETIHGEVIRLVSTVKPAPACWVDTGCGTGRLVEEALRTFPTAHFVLADPSESMLGQAAGRFAKVEPARLTILPRIDSAGLTVHLANGTADVLTAIQCHHYLQPPERLKALQACHETLKPGGLFVTFENIAPRTAEGVRLGLAGWKSFLMSRGRTQPEAEQHVARYGRDFFPITAEQHLSVLGKTGFSVVELFWYSQMQAGFYAIK